MVSVVKFAIVDGTPVPKVLELPCQRVSEATGLTLVSGYRGDQADALLRGLGKMSQRKLWDCDQNFRRTGRCLCSSCNPANPPGFSTHECFNDGVAYLGARGRRLEDWQCGMDWSFGAGAVREFNRLDYVASLTYPGNPREGQHVNLDRKPRTNVWIADPLVRGDRDQRVKFIKHQLHYLRDPEKDWTPYFMPGEKRPVDGWGTQFTADLADAVERFQRDHDQRDDGVVGYQTKRQINVSYRHRQERQRAKKRGER